MILTFTAMKAEIAKRMVDVPGAYFTDADLNTLLQSAVDDFAAQTRLLKVSEKTIVVPAGSTEVIIPEATLLGSTLTDAGSYIIDIESVEWNRDSTGSSPNWTKLTSTIGRDGWLANIATQPNQTSSDPAIWYAEYVAADPSGSHGAYVTKSVGRQLRIYPRPTDSTNARLRWTGHRSHVQLANLTLGSSYPEFPAECIEGLMAYVEHFLHLRDENDSRADMLWNKYQQYVIKAGGTYSPKAEEYPRMTPRTRRMRAWSRYGAMGTRG